MFIYTVQNIDKVPVTFAVPISVELTVTYVSNWLFALFSAKISDSIGKWNQTFNYNCVLCIFSSS